MHRVVPELIVEKFKAGQFQGEFPAIGMFLDLSGFSTMTDALMQHGQHGAEVLASLMHGVFDPLVESIFEYGGKIVGFAGDGIMALYPIETDSRMTALRALASAHLIQTRLEENPARQTVYGKYPISAKIGLTHGSVSWGILRSYQGDQATYYFRGTAVDDSAHAEHHASPGEILLTENLCSLLGTDIETTTARSNRHPYERFRGFRIEPPGIIPVHFPPIDVEVSRLFMPADVISHDVRGEFRQIVNLFMRFPELDTAQMRELTSQVFELRNKYGGLLTRVDFGDKGCNMLILWGAPVAYENDIGRALNFLIDLKARIDFPITAGVTYYIAHAGYLGSTLCEDYTCYGWGVNLASRFMMNAPTGEIWVDDRIARRVARRFEIDFVGSQSFKGFAAEQKVHRLNGHRKVLEPPYQGELVGREDELASLKHFIEPLWQGKFAGLMLISGDAGIGKGRLVYEFRSSETFADRQILWAVCQSDQILRQSFNPLRGWLLRYFGFSVDDDTDARRLKFDSRMDELHASIPDLELAHEIERTRSVLGALVDLHWSNSLYEQLDAEGRYNNTFLALIAFLKAESLRRPVVIFLEDLQFTDNDSKDFLPQLKRSILAAKESYPVAMIVTTRPHAMTLAEDAIDERIHVAGLARDAVARLAENLLGGAPSPELTSMLWTRSEGNPYFAEQIIRYLQEDNFLETSAYGWALIRRLRNNFLPSDIQSILVARLDQLTRDVKEIIQTASVLGREFEVQVLLNMIRDGQEDAQENVYEAEKAVIWSPLNDIRYIFTHGLLRDAAYEMQMRARRRELHAMAVEALEHLYSGELIKNHYAELAHHSEFAGFGDKALFYYKLAGRQSFELFQNHDAVDYFTRAIILAPPRDLELQFDLTAERVELFNRLAKRDLQLKDLTTLEALAKQMKDDIRLTKTWLLYITYFYLTGKYAEAIDYGQRSFTASVVPMEPELIFGARITWFLSLLRLGRSNEAMQLAQETLVLVRQTASQRQLGRVLSAIGLVAFEQREPSHAESYFKEALEISHELKDRNLESRALNNLALHEAGVNGDFIRAYEYYRETLEIAHTIGDRNAESYALGNLGFASGMLGNFSEAIKFLEQALLIAREQGNIYNEVYILTNLSANTGIKNDASLAINYAQQAVELSLKVGDPSGEAWGWLYLGHGLLLSRQIDQARSAFIKSIEIREKLDQLALAMEPIAGLIEVGLSQGDLQGALLQTERIFVHLQNGGTLNGTDEPLRVYYNCFQLLDKKQDPRTMQVLQLGIQVLQAQISKFKDEHARRTYIENVPWRFGLQNAGRKAGLL